VPLSPDASFPFQQSRFDQRAALTGQAGGGKVVCVVSGGNINLAKLASILSGADG
jgi:threonine dehydratase